jgi:hypothetical protein
MAREILFEGFSRDQILRLPAEQIEKLVLTGEPIVFAAGSARILGEFRLRGNRLVVTLAQIEGGGEGVLPSLWRLMEDYAKSRSLEGVEWIVHAVSCARPNPKLKRVLERRGFTIRDVEGVSAYCYDQGFLEDRKK